MLKKGEVKMIHKMAKEARFGKTPDTVIFNNNGDYSIEDLQDLTIEQLEQLMKKELQKILEAESKDTKTIDKLNT